MVSTDLSVLYREFNDLWHLRAAVTTIRFTLRLLRSVYYTCYTDLESFWTTCIESYSVLRWMQGNVQRRHRYIVTLNNDVVRSTDTTRMWKRTEFTLYPRGFLIVCWIISRVSNGLSTNATWTYLASQCQEQCLICMKTTSKTKWYPYLQRLHGPCRLLVGLRTQMWRSSWAIVIHPKTTLYQGRSYISHSVILRRLHFRILRSEEAGSNPRRILFHVRLPAQVQPMSSIVVLSAIRLAYLFSQRQKHVVEYPPLPPLRALPINLLQTPAKRQWHLTMSSQRCKA